MLNQRMSERIIWNSPKSWGLLVLLLIHSVATFFSSRADIVHSVSVFLSGKKLLHTSSSKYKRTT